jgi:hypothetical protein
MIHLTSCDFDVNFQQYPRVYLTNSGPHQDLVVVKEVNKWYNFSRCVVNNLCTEISSILLFYFKIYDMHKHFPILQSWSPFLLGNNVACGEIGGNTSRMDQLFDPSVSWCLCGTCYLPMLPQQ